MQVGDISINNPDSASSSEVAEQTEVVVDGVIVSLQCVEMVACSEGDLEVVLISQHPSQFNRLYAIINV